MLKQQLILTKDDKIKTLNNINNPKENIYLAKLGNLIIEIDTKITFYLPQIITHKQYQYIMENKNSFFGNVVDIISICVKNNEYYTVNIQNINNFDFFMTECQKKYISYDNSYVMIIPNEKNIKIDNGYFIKTFDSNILAGHGEIFKLFCIRNFISISIPDSGGYYWGKKLASEGFLSMQKEDS